MILEFGELSPVLGGLKTKCTHLVLHTNQAIEVQKVNKIGRVGAAEAKEKEEIVLRYVCVLMKKAK